MPDFQNPNEPMLPEGFNPTPSLSDLIQDDSLSFRERLAKMFKPTDFVRVENIDTVPFEWQEQPIANEFVHQPDKVTYDVYRKNPNRYILRPGEQRVLDGGNAYLMVENLFKKMIIAKTVGKGTGMGSPQTQIEYISRIVKGVEDLNSLTAFTNRTPDVASDLGLDNDITIEPVKKRGRQATV